EQNGWFQPAHTPGRIKLSEKRVEAWRRHGFPAELYGREETETLLGSRYWYGGMFNPTGGHINPLALARGLAGTAERHGARLFEDTPVTHYTREGTAWRVTTPGGTLKARALVLATNAYTDLVVARLASRLARTMVPVISWQMATEPIGDNVRATLLPGRQAVSDTRGDLLFFRYDARNRLITGGAVIGPLRQAERVAAKGTARLSTAFPQLGNQPMSHVWSGALSMTWDRFPRIHQLGPDAWSWIGCNGRGVALSVSLGRELAGAVSGRPLDELALPVSEMRPLPFQSIARHIAPAYLAWLKRKDRQEPSF
ncbi:MAG: FAD-binding oxidoreductase, partial [Pseudomonadota bacterium]